MRLCNQSACGAEFGSQMQGTALLAIFACGNVQHVHVGLINSEYVLSARPLVCMVSSLESTKIYIATYFINTKF